MKQGKQDAINVLAVQPTLNNCKRHYESPLVSYLGDLRDLTLGTSPGLGDSGNAGTHRCTAGVNCR